MLSLIVGLAVAGGLPHARQAESPVFRAEVYVVPVEFSMGRRWLGLFRRPYTDLTVEDVAVVLDELTYPAVELTQDPDRPGHYVVTFTPPEDYRDGESHLIELIVRWGTRRPARMPMTMTFPEPSDESGRAELPAQPVSE